MGSPSSRSRRRTDDTWRQHFDPTRQLQGVEIGWAAAYYPSERLRLQLTLEQVCRLCGIELTLCQEYSTRSLRRGFCVSTRTEPIRGLLTGLDVPRRQPVTAPVRARSWRDGQR